MAYDPAWDMPKQNWRQQGSFEIPEIPPAYDPDAAPLVCLPQINQHWLPFVMGALDQLRNPSAWLVADEDAMSTVLYRVSRLKQMIGVEGECVSYAVRFDPTTCQLQESTDGGTTWAEIDGWSDFVSCLPPQTLVDFDSGCTLNQSLDGGTTYEAVPGWLDNFSDCVQKYVPIIGLPPNPGDKSPDQLACAIATYLAEQVIVAAMGKAVTAISDDLTLLQFGLDVVNIIPEFVLVGLAADAFSAIYVAIQEGNLSDFEDALTDATLLSAVVCAIYGAIESDGYVTPGNFAAIVSAIAGISYAHPAVIDAIVSYLDALGATGVAQVSQVAGLEQGEDCSSCTGNWCYHWNFAVSDGGWVDYVNSPDTGVYVHGTGWQSEVNPGIGYQATVIAKDLGSEFVIDQVSLFIITDNSASSNREINGQVDYGVSSVWSEGLGLGPSPYPGSAAIVTPPADGTRYLVYNFASDLGPQTADTLVYVEIHGTGTLPDTLTGGEPC